MLSDGVAHLAAAQARAISAPSRCCPGRPAAATKAPRCSSSFTTSRRARSCTSRRRSRSITSFAQNIRDLRAAGCDIIVDDVGYFVETPFQDGQGPAVVSPTNGGVVAQAVKDVAALGRACTSRRRAIPAISNDGTSGVWEGDFATGGATGAPMPRRELPQLHRRAALRHLDPRRVRPHQSVLVGSARRVGQRLRPVPAEHGRRPPSPRARRTSRTATTTRTSR